MNIFQIEQELESIFDTIEANEGEITPELEEYLSITQEDFKDKIKSYANVIKQIDADLSAIKCEKDRLKHVEETKKKTKERLSNIICTAIMRYGDTTKSGSRFIDYGTGKVSVRTTQVCEENKDAIEQCSRALWSLTQYYNEIGQLDLLDALSSEDYNTIMKDMYNNINSNRVQFGLEPLGELYVPTEDDIKALNFNISFDINAKELMDGSSKDILKKIASLIGIAKLKPSIDKKYVKESNSSFEFATIKENNNLTIK